MIFKYVVVMAALSLAGCAGMQPPTPPGTSQKASPTAPSQPRQLIIFIPQTDEAAVAWLKLFDRYPSLRMVIAMSPRFNRFSKEPLLKEKTLALQKSGRLELALQLPNAPFLPLLINTDSAKEALPPGTPLPTPPFIYPEDAAQIIGKAKSDFSTRIWNIHPKGLVIPQGAVNAELLRLLNQLGFAWVVGALGAPANAGAYRVGSLNVWDATPAKENPQFTIQVWDERMSGNPTQSLQTLSAWADALSKKGVLAVLPSDPDLPSQILPEDVPWGGRTWMTKDWSPWIGSAPKNAAWSWLRKTREALEKFKNSGQASVRRLDMAFEEIYTAENANYFSGITEGETTFTMSEDREREFKATLSSVYRLIGQSPPDTLFSTTEIVTHPGFKRSSSTVSWETLADGRGHLTLEDPAGDDHGAGKLVDPLGPKAAAGTYDLRRLEIWVSSETLDWAVTLGGLQGSTLGNFQTPGPLVDIYLDLNGQPNVGTVALLSERGASTAASDAWEYAFSLWGSQAQFYRTRGAESYEISDTVPLVFGPSLNGGTNRVRFSIPRSWLRGNPQRWGYQALVMSYDPKSLESSVRPLKTADMVASKRLPIYDLIDSFTTPQMQLMTAIEEGIRNDVPFVRLNVNKP